MPVPEEFIKKRTEVTVSRASLKEVQCRSCGAKIGPENIVNGYAKCAYCGSSYALSVDG
jgi:DNA-directed RNA polymerase subunit RPC12/RpoP